MIRVLNFQTSSDGFDSLLCHCHVTRRRWAPRLCSRGTWHGTFYLHSYCQSFDTVAW